MFPGRCNQLAQLVQFTKLFTSIVCMFFFSHAFGLPFSLGLIVVNFQTICLAVSDRVLVLSWMSVYLLARKLMSPA